MLDWLKSKLTPNKEASLQPESSYVVTISDAEISCRHPNGVTESVAWDELEIVAIETTDLGPFVPDVFWQLAGKQSGCVVPQGATGEDALIRRLQALPRFDNEKMIEAMASTSNQTFICWKREDLP